MSFLFHFFFFFVIFNNPIVFGFFWEKHKLCCVVMVTTCNTMWSFVVRRNTQKNTHTYIHTYDTHTAYATHQKKKDGLPIYFSWDEKKAHQLIQLPKNCSYIHRLPLQNSNTAKKYMHNEINNTQIKYTHTHTHTHKSEKIRKIAIFCSICFIQPCNDRINNKASKTERKKKAKIKTIAFFVSFIAVLFW